MNNINNIILLSIILVLIFIYFVRSDTCIKPVKSIISVFAPEPEHFTEGDWLDELFDMIIAEAVINNIDQFQNSEGIS